MTEGRRPGIGVSYVDAAARPCQDFFAFANGAWLRDARIPEDESTFGSWSEVRDSNDAALRAIVEAAAAGGAAPGSDLQLVGDLFASGMDERTITAAGLRPAAAELDLVADIADRAGLIRALGTLHASIAPTLHLMVRPDPKDSTTNRLHLQQGGLGLPDRDYYVREDAKSRALLDDYRAHIQRMLALAGAAEGEARDGMEAVLRLETRLARASMTRVDQRDPYKVANTMPLAQLVARTPGFAWPEYLAAAGAPPVEDVNPRQPDLFAELGRAVADVPLDEWRVYLRWHVLRSNAAYLAAPFEDEHFSFYGRRLQGQKEQKPRWERVVAVINSHSRSVGQALGRLYVEREFPPEAKTRMRDLVEHLRAALAERIRGLEWMGPATKEAALAKLAAFEVKVGYPDRWQDLTGLRIDGGAYLASVRAIRRFEQELELAKLGQPVDRTEWRMTAPTVNAYYNASFNEIVFPAGILRPPFFDHRADDASNFGAIGVVIGHEMSHGFDDAGSQYDAHGNLRNWWTAEDRGAYEARTQLMVEQFDGYEPLPAQRVNGKLTLGENIGDLGGVKIAYAGLQHALEQNGRPDDLDGFTPEQRFFIAHAQVWRTIIRDEALLLRLLTDPHSPSRLRVNGPLSNLPEFHRAFGCGEGDAMCRPDASRPAIW